MDLGRHLPEILKRLPVKSLVRFRSVSKAWSHLITDPLFATKHLRFNKSSSSSSSVFGSWYPQFKYVRIDNTHKTTLESLETPFPWRLKPDPYPRPAPRYHGSCFAIRGHCNGLVLAFESTTFLVGHSRAKPIYVDRYIISNPIARRFQILPESAIDPPNLFVDPYHEYGYRHMSAVGLGFVDDVVYKVVRVTYGVAEAKYSDSMNEFKSYEPPWVEAYDSRSCNWRRVPINSEFSYEYLNDGVFNSHDGCLYWLGNRGYKYYVLVSFHLVDETWRETLLPYKSSGYDDGEGAFDGYGYCQFVQVLGESVVLFVGDRRNKLLCNVWKMNREEDEVSWTHVCRFNFFGCPLGFVREGEVLLMMYGNRTDDPRTVFMGNGTFFERELCPREDDGRFVLLDLKKKNNACYGFTDLDFRVGHVVPDFVESLLLLDGEGEFNDDASEETYYFPLLEVVFGKFTSIFDDPEEKEEDFGDFWSMFDEIEEEDFGDLSSMFDDNF